MRTSFGCEVNRHTTRCTSPVSVVSEHSWCLAKVYRNGDQRGSVDPWLGKDFTFLRLYIKVKKVKVEYSSL